MTIRHIKYDVNKTFYVFLSISTDHPVIGVISTDFIEDFPPIHGGSEYRPPRFCPTLICLSLVALAEAVIT